VDFRAQLQLLRYHNRAGILTQLGQHGFPVLFINLLLLRGLERLFCNSNALLSSI